MMLETKGHEQHAQRPLTAIYIKCSRCIQALDLSIYCKGGTVDFDDFEFLTPDAWTPLPAIVKLWFALIDMNL